MNIFALDRDPKKVPGQMCDKHVVKMMVEGTQMMCYAIHLRSVGWEPGDDNTLGSRKTLFDKICSIDNPVTYVPNRIHTFHSCVIWAASSNDNFSWLTEYTKALLREYSNRYGKNSKCNVQFTQANAHWRKTQGRGNWENASPWAMAFSHHSKPFVEVDNSLGEYDSVIDAYQQYYTWKWCEWGEMKIRREVIDPSTMTWFKKRVHDLYVSTPRE